MNIFERFYLHAVYIPFIAFKFSLDYYALGKQRYFSKYSAPGWEYKSRVKYQGFNLKWDVPSELYKGDLRKDYIDEYGSVHKQLY
jgi:hypothetical protein